MKNRILCAAFAIMLAFFGFAFAETEKIRGDLEITGRLNAGEVFTNTLDTGHGANELFGMDQDVRTTDSPTFAGGTRTGDVNYDGNYTTGQQNITDLASRGPGYWFDGSNDVITVPDNAAFNLGISDFSFIWTIKPIDSLANGHFGKYQSANDHWYVNEVGGHDNLQFYAKIGGVEVADYDTGYGVIKDDVWHILAFTSDRDATKGQFYVDGKAIITTESIAMFTSSLTNTADLLIPGVSGSYINTMMRDFRLFNLALSADEVKALSSGGEVPDQYQGASQADVFSGWDFTSGWTAYGGAVISDANTFTTSGIANDGVYVTSTPALKVGKTYRITMNGTVSAGSIFLRAASDSTVIMSGFGTVEYTIGKNQERLWIVNNTASTVDIATLEVTQIGCVLDLTPENASTTTWFDQSGNGLNGIVSGAKLINTPQIKTLRNQTPEDIDGGRESSVVFEGKQSGGETTTLAKITVSHDGTGDDQKGKVQFKVNDGTDGNSPTPVITAKHDGCVGIGTEPDVQLHVAGTGDGYGNLVEFERTSTDEPDLTISSLGNAANPYIGFNTQGNIGFTTGIANPLLADPRSDSAMVIKTDGHVGVGTPSPTAHFHIVGENPTIRLQDLAPTTADFSIKAVGDNFQIYDGRTSTTPFHINYNGYIGIGTTSPQEKLDIFAGNLQLTHGRLYVQDDVSSASLGVGQFLIKGQTDTNKTMWFQLDTTDNVGKINAGRSGTGAYNLALADYGGNVGIGTTGPDAKLHVMQTSGDDNDTGLLVETTNSAERSRITFKQGSAIDDMVLNLNSTGFHMGWGSGSLEDFSINSNGNVGIGTPLPESTLHVPDGKYAQFQDNNAGAPPAADCDSDDERGRQSIDTTNNRLYICNGATRGWDYISLTD